MAGYTRVDTINNIADGNVINAADLDGEFDGIQAAFNSSTGHNHDGTAGEGAPILALGPTQNVTISASVFGVGTTNTVDLGTSSLKFKDFYLAGAASIGGTLGVTGATTLSAALTYGGVTLSNAVTGTGNMVLSASPTLTGTITAAAANFSGAVALNGNTTIGDADTDTITQTASYVTGTQLKSAKTATNTLSLAAYDTDGVAYTDLITLTASTTPTLALTSTGVGTINNMSIGATTASTGAFTSLTASTTLAVTGVATFSAGTAALPAITTTGDTNTGIFFPAADTIAFTEGGVEAMRIDSSGNLNFTGTAQRILGDFSNATTANGVLFQSSTTNGATSLGAIPNGTATGSSIRFFNNSDPTNASFLVVQAMATEVRLNSNIAGTGTYVPMTFYTGGGERARIDTSGNVGIAQTDPTTNGVSGFNNLVIGNSASTAAGITLRVSNSTTPTTGIVWARNTGGANGFVKYDQTNEAMQFGVAGVEKMRIDSSGRVGIGTSSPTRTLDIAAATGTAIAFLSSTTGTNAVYYAAGNTGGNFHIGRENSAGTTFGSSAYASVLWSEGAYPLVFATNNNERIRIDSSGNVGIGTTSPSNAKLDIASGNINLSDTYILAWGGSSGRPNIEGSKASSYLKFSTGGGTTHMMIDSSGNVGIGTSSPYTKLDVTQATAGYGSWKYCLGANATDYPAIRLLATTGNTGNIIAHDAGNLVFLTGTTATAAGTERMRINSSGYVLVGTTTSGGWNSNAQFEAKSTGGSAVSAYYASSSGGQAILCRVDGTTPSLINFFSSTTNVGSITTNGTITAYNTTSDYRLKDITGSVTGAKDFIMALKPKQGTWKSDGSKFVGFLAHEFQEVSPTSVTGVKDAVDADGKPIMQSMQASSAEVIANLVAHIQNLETRLAALETI